MKLKRKERLQIDDYQFPGILHFFWNQSNSTLAKRCVRLFFLNFSVPVLADVMIYRIFIQKQI